MIQTSRRDFGKLALASLPLSAAFAAKVNSTVSGVRLGVQTYSYRALPSTGEFMYPLIIKSMMEDGLGECELFAPQVEKRTSPDGVRLDPKSDAGKAARAELRKWRLEVPLDHFRGVRKEFEAAGILIYAYNLSFRDDFTDAEIDRGFEHAKALGVSIITASTTLPIAKRVAPFAEKHKIYVAMHGHSNLTDPNEFATPESFRKAMAMSKYFKINLDIGHFTAANFDAVAFLKENHANITNLHLKDRKRNEGDNLEWGQGETPIKPVLQLLKETKWSIPAYIEYEYKGTSGPVEEVRKCFDFAKRALA